MSSADAPLWSGRLGGLDPRAQALNDSLPVDHVLWPEELRLTAAWSEALIEAGVLDAAGRDSLVAAARALEADLAAGRVTLSGEDVHSGVEAELVRRCGAPGLRLHTGRSRNDQVATLFRMRLMTLCDEAVAGLEGLERALLVMARRSGDAMVAAQTHLQPAQPVLLAQLWLAHLHALSRDEERFRAARESADRLPLGSGAVAGSPLVFDRTALAARLGFSRLAENSVDAVGDRDFALDYLQAAAQVGVHLSRLAEDLVLWCSPGWGWYRPGDGFSTGSSLLPQKRNPDLFELTRGKAGRLIANAAQLAIVLKGLPSSYQKDLQEDKEAVLDSATTLSRLFAALPAAIESLTPDVARQAAGLSVDLLAVELADHLVARGVPFREAHGAVGRLWAEAERAGVAPAALPAAARLVLSPHFDDATLAGLDHRAAVERRSHAPGAGSGSVAQQVAAAEARLGTPAPRSASSGPAAAVAAAPIGNPAAPSGRPAATAGRPTSPAGRPAAPADDLLLRRARPGDVPALSKLISGHVADGTLLPRPLGELYMSVREFHVAERGGVIVGCAALRLLWRDLGEVRSLAVSSDAQGLGLGRKLVTAVVDDARAAGLERVIALTREVPFFERCGFTIVTRESLPRKVWTDCIHCPRRHACDETAVVLDLVPGATERAATEPAGWELPIPPAAPLAAAARATELAPVAAGGAASVPTGGSR